MENLYCFYAEGDYAPVAYGTKDEIFDIGDNVHNAEFESYSELYAKANGFNYVGVDVYCDDVLDKYKQILETWDAYEEFYMHLNS